MLGTLFIVGTPIGNLEDITLRALKTLQDVDLILCEDTRVTKKLLAQYGITTKTQSYHAHTDPKKAAAILELLEAGSRVALVSDAGTPGISDPGFLLVKQVWERFLDEAKVVTIPGPSAVVAALSIAGLPTSEFVFLGFLPHKKGRETLFKEIAQQTRTVVFYESPHRIEKTLASLEGVLSSKRMIAVCRELTKVFEEVVRGESSKVRAYFREHQDRVRGEFVVVVSPE